MAGSTHLPAVPVGAPDPAAPRFAARVPLLESESAFEIAPYVARVQASGRRVVRCTIGEPDFPVPEHIREEVVRQLRADNAHYVDPQGILPLREAVADEVSAARGIEVTPDRVVIFPGAKTPIGLAQQTYCDPGDEVIYPTPGFPIYESFTRYVGATPVPLEVREETGFALTAADLEPLITPRTRLVYLNSPANPTGGVISRRELEEIAEVILRRGAPGIRVFSDEIYEKILFDGAAHASIASVPGMAERTIILSGVSKSYSWTGGRVGWAVFPTAAEAAVFKKLNINYFSCVAPYNQMGAVAAIRSPESAPCIASMVAAFQDRRDFMVPRLNEIPGVTCGTPGGAFYVFPNVSGACERVGATEAWRSLEPATRVLTSPATLFKLFLLFRHGVATLDRRAFGKIGAEGRDYLRISVATAMDDLRDAADGIEAAAGDADGFASFIAEGGPLF